MISPKAFKYLKNKHIKKIIFKNSNGTLGIISSLKHIKKHLTTNEQYSGERKTHKENNPGINTSHMLKFIKENLKVKSHYNEKPKAYKDPVVASMGQTFYSNHRKEKKSLKINNQKVSIRQLSRAALNNYELK